MERIGLSEINSALDFANAQFEMAVNGQNSYVVNSYQTIIASLKEHKRKFENNARPPSNYIGEEEVFMVEYGCSFDEDIYHRKL